MADPIVRKLKADLAKAEAEVRKWQEIVDGFEKTLLFYEPRGEAAGEVPVHIRTRATPGRVLNDAMYEIVKDTGRPWYYKDLYSALQARGVSVPGKDPVANVVAHLSGDERFENVGRGMWYLTRVLTTPTAAPGRSDGIPDGGSQDDRDNEPGNSRGEAPAS